MGQSTVISRDNTNGKYIALTFDDGSNPTRTLSILNILSKYNVKCTFFLTGESISAFPSSAREILQYGHEIGNHTYSHP